MSRALVWQKQTKGHAKSHLRLLTRPLNVLKAAPRLIPICSHRYIPEEPHDAGNPVFSVMQSDVIYYGADLANYSKGSSSLRRPPVSRSRETSGSSRSGRNSSSGTLCVRLAASE